MAASARNTRTTTEGAPLLSRTTTEGTREQQPQYHCSVAECRCSVRAGHEMRHPRTTTKVRMGRIIPLFVKRGEPIHDPRYSQNDHRKIMIISPETGFSFVAPCGLTSTLIECFRLRLIRGNDSHWVCGFIEISLLSRNLKISVYARKFSSTRKLSFDRQEVVASGHPKATPTIR